MEALAASVESAKSRKNSGRRPHHEDDEVPQERLRVGAPTAPAQEPTEARKRPTN